jgi:hypothetical protein
MSETLNFSIPLAYGFGWCYRQEAGEGGVPKFSIATSRPVSGPMSTQW